jgi:2-keto-4-pentenoate hydratase/2-oxohepta-3-ene-1,7-dioic acid hydratase in catechol pathway
MRLVTYSRGGQDARAGLLIDGDRILDAEDAARLAGATQPDRWRAVRSIVAGGQEALDTLARGAELAPEDGSCALADAELGPPVPDPRKIVCLGLNYRDHAEEMGLPIPAAPIVFAKFAESLVGPSAEIVIPALTQLVDYEAELAIVIGRTCRNVPEAEALSVVFGAMAFNDVSARDLQNKTSQWMLGKAIDTFAPCGPALVTRDELGDLQALGVEARVNGQVVQSGNTALMIFSIAETIAYLSQLMTLQPGDIIATGTPPGVGISRDPQILLKPGDRVDISIEGVGTISNPVVAGG